MFNVIESGNFNRVVEPPYPSGASAIPYTFGWSNKYAPKPFGVRVRPDIYSSWSRNPKETVPSGTILNQIDYYGPINSIYEVEISGVGAGNCIDCDSVNGKYYLYSTHNYGSNDNTIIPGTLYRGVTWFGTACSRIKPTNFCGINDIRLTLGVNNNRWGTATATSGELNLTLVLYRTNAFIKYASQSDGGLIASGNMVFNKSFGYINSLRYEDRDNKPFMLEGEQRLSGLVENYNCVWPNIGPPGQTTLNNFSCDLSNAIAIIRPFKQQFYDLGTSSLLTGSGEFFPGAGNLVNNTIPTQNNNYYQGLSNTHSPFPACSNYYSGSTDHLITAHYRNAGPSGYAYKFRPLLYELSISGLSNNRVNNTCRTCDDFYKRKKNLISRDDNSSILEYQDINFPVTDGNFLVSHYYTWYSNSVLEQVGGTDRVFPNYYNICDHGCNDVYNTSTRVDDFTQGLCNNFINLRIKTSGNYLSSPVMMEAMLMFGGVYISGVAGGITAASSPYALKRVICDDTGPVKCTQAYRGPTLIIGTINSGVMGLIDCFDSTIFDGYWTKVINDDRFFGVSGNQTPRSPLPNYLDAFAYCGLESGLISLKPNISPQTPCARWQCNIVDNVMVPRTVNLTFTPHLNSSVNISGFSTKTIILAQNGGTCKWTYSNTVSGIPVYGGPPGYDTTSFVETASANFEDPSSASVSAGYGIGTVHGTFIGDNNSIYVFLASGFASSDFNSTWTMSGINTGTSQMSFNSLNPLTRNLRAMLWRFIYVSGVSSGPFINEDLVLEGGTADISLEFADMYDIRDYL